MALPFGLASAPRVFTKVLAPIFALLRQRGISIVGYLDDLLLRAASAPELREDVAITMHTLQEFGWVLNLKKSVLVQTPQCLEYLGLLLDSVDARVFFPSDKLQTQDRSEAVEEPHVVVAAFLHASSGPYGGFLRGGTVHPISLSLAEGDIVEMGQISVIPGSTDLGEPVGQGLSSLVAEISSPSVREIAPTASLDGDHNGCQPDWLGWSIGSIIDTGPLVEGGIPVTDQCARASSDQAMPLHMVDETTRTSDQDPVRQCHSGGICQPSRRNEKLGRSTGGHSHPCSGLASVSLICQPDTPGGGCSLAVAGAGGPPIARSDTSSCFTVAGFNGVAVESQVLRN